MIFNYVIPIILQQVLTTFHYMLDNFMVAGLGSIEIGAMMSANRFIFIIRFTILAFAIANAVFSAQMSSRIDKVSRYFYISTFVSLFFSLAFIILYFSSRNFILGTFSNDPNIIAGAGNYIDIVIFTAITQSIILNLTASLRSIGLLKIPLNTILLIVFSNFLMNGLMIKGRVELGLQGAAVATLAAEILGMVFLILSVMLNKKEILSNNIHETSLAEVTKYIRFSMVIWFSHIIWAMYVMLFQNLIGGLGAQELAAFGVVAPIELMFYEIGISLGFVLVVFVGKDLAENKFDEAYHRTKRFVKFIAILSIFVSVLILLLSKFLLALYNISAEESAIAFNILRWLAVFLSVKIIAPLFYNGSLRAGGDMAYILGVTTFLSWGLILPIAYTGYHFFNFGLIEIYITVGLSEIVSLVLLFARFHSKKWMKKIDN